MILEQMLALFYVAGLNDGGQSDGSQPWKEDDEGR
jgi:hypothetical protein